MRLRWPPPVCRCRHYELSKGKSLLAFLSESDTEKATKLLLDLFEYYELHFSPKHSLEESDEFGNIAFDEIM